MPGTRGCICPARSSASRSRCWGLPSFASGATACWTRGSRLAPSTGQLRAALELAAAHDPRITNQRAWQVGLAALPDAHRARNVILDDAAVRRIVAAAYDHDRALGFMTDIAAVTGARLSQLARLEVA